MSTFTAILEPDAKGMLHLPVPTEWGNARVRVKAELEPLSGEGKGLPALAKGFGCLRGRISMSPDFDSPLEEPSTEQPAPVEWIEQDMPEDGL